MKREIRIVLILILIVATAVLVSGCFTGAFEIGTITPEMDATDVGIDTTIVAEANVEFDPATVTDTSVRLIKGTAAGGSPVAATTTVAGATLTIAPETTLDFGTLYTVVLEGTISNDRGAPLSGQISWSFTTSPLLVTVTTPTLEPIIGTAVAVNSSFSGVTDNTGTLNISMSSGGTGTVSVSPAFFVGPYEQTVALDGTVYEVNLNADQPYIYVPDFFGASTPVPKIVRMSAIDAAFGTYDSETTFFYAPATAYTLQGPRAVEVDYSRGIMYVADASINDSPVAILRITAWPPAVDGSDVDYVLLTGANEIYGAQQIVPQEDGSLVMIDADLFTFGGQYRLIRVPVDLNHANTEFGPWFVGGPPPSMYSYGLVQLSDDSFVVFGGQYNSVVVAVHTGIQDSTPGTFGLLSFGSGSNQLAIPHRAIASPDGEFVYISDSGDTFAPNNSRIVRVTDTGVGFSTFGSVGTGINQFANPVILGLLPDNKLYIMDMTNDRIVRIDSGALGGSPVNWTESDAGANWDLRYWYNYS